MLGCVDGGIADTCVFDGQYSLIALVVGLASVLEPAGILNGDGLARGGLGTSALLNDGLGNAHCEGRVELVVLFSGRVTEDER